MNGPDWKEQGIVFNCGDNNLVGIAALPQADSDIGVVILVGGPQYRVGSHRQFTLLARDLAQAGIPSLRFDYSGMGDSDGEQIAFSDVRNDVFAAIDAFQKIAPGVRRIVLWGLCDAASTAMMFAHQHDAVHGLVLLNPWVHGDEHSPGVKLSHYYRPLLAARENWGRLLAGDIKLRPAVAEFLSSSLRSILGFFGISRSSWRHSFVQQMLLGFQSYSRGSLVILSQNDLTAQEFSSLLDADRAWRSVVSRDAVSTHTVTGADHTFSSRVTMQQVADLTINWVKSC